MIETILWHDTDDGYVSHRIPALIFIPTASNGRLLAFCEARKDMFSYDVGTIRITMRISDDLGKSWTPSREIAADGVNTVMNPTPVYDAVTDTLWMFCIRKERDSDFEAERNLKRKSSMWVLHSHDHGDTWSEPVDITTVIDREGWSSSSFGPCHGIQLKSGRLLIPGYHYVYDPVDPLNAPSYSMAVYSDDHGKTWQVGQPVDHPGSNECCAVETDDGNVHLYCRCEKGGGRFIADSTDGGVTWDEVRLEADLPDPRCQASVLAVPNGSLVFTNPSHPTERINETVHISKDGGKNWAVHSVLHNGPSAYSDLAQTENGNICCLYECGDNWRYERIVFTSFTL